MSLCQPVLQKLKFLNSPEFSLLTNKRSPWVSEFGRSCHGKPRNFANWLTEFGKIFRGKLSALLISCGCLQLNWLAQQGCKRPIFKKSNFVGFYWFFGVLNFGGFKVELVFNRRPNLGFRSIGWFVCILLPTAYNIPAFANLSV